MNFYNYIKIYHLLSSACPKKEDISETGKIKEPLFQKDSHFYYDRNNNTLEAITAL